MPLTNRPASSPPAFAADIRKPVIAIIGGGFSGAAVALHLNRAAPGGARIVIVEPAAEIGRGLAYGTTDPGHRINVPTHRMQLFSDDPEHFSRWCTSSDVAARDPAALDSAGRLFPTRHAFGTYVQQQVAALGPALLHVRTRAVAVERHTAGYRVICADGDPVEADALVLAICHPPPSVPAVFKDVANDAAMIANPWRDGAFEDIARDSRILIVGTGLTMADIVTTLERQGHRGKITAISRRGQRSRDHAAAPVEPFGDFLSPPPRTAIELLTRIRRAVAEAAGQGLSWHGVLDQVRIQASDIWRALPAEQKHALLRHLRPFWDTHRFRVAPQLSRIIERLTAAGRLRVLPAALQEIAKAGAELHVTVRHSRRQSTEQISVDRIILATGPAHGDVCRNDPLLKAMQQADLLRPDPFGLGIEVDAHSRPLDRSGAAEGRLFVAGPLARATFGELMGVPDVSIHARRVAEALVDVLHLEGSTFLGTGLSDAAGGG